MRKKKRLFWMHKKRLRILRAKQYPRCSWSKSDETKKFSTRLHTPIHLQDVAPAGLFVALVIFLDTKIMFFSLF